MLTFFDYLRQRAFESVLAGAQEALEVLESQKSRREPPRNASSLAAPRLASQAGAPATQPEEISAQGDDSEDDDELLPAPRRRGRPDERPKGQG
jgi:hypothetical protein